MKKFLSDFNKLIKLRLTLTVVFSASICFLMGSKQQGDINWINWVILTVGGFLVTGAANGFNEIIEKDLDKLMKRTMDRPIPSGHMTTGQALVLSLIMGIAGTYLLLRLNFPTGVLAVFSIFLYAFVYTPMKRKSPIAVFIGAFPGALPPLIGYFAAFHEPRISWIPVILFLIQFVWQFPHFWAIAWVLDEDYKRAGFQLLPTTKQDKTSAFMTLASTIILIPVSLMPTIYLMPSGQAFGGNIYGAIALIAGLYFCWQAVQLYQNRDVTSAKQLMYTSFFYLPLLQLTLLFDFIAK
ncbi:heme o synthase [Daejeonella lutea]|uniref:Protoheme IX farnesyltransferase n=1 Tax=Daejeonella lutea TaxID=572036 RepID=A0A1T5D0M7_9SPHI|nr:heme o synthase [Daejeonella lutea]SKB65254.1 protoheme IX farnesyltransferase [Daejeonella lutea]